MRFTWPWPALGPAGSALYGDVLSVPRRARVCRITGDGRQALSRTPAHPEFESVTATFAKPGGGTATLTIPADGGAIVDKASATSKAWIATPAGWTLTGATAEITGTAKKFNLTHTCPAGGGSSPSDSPAPSTTATASPSTSDSGAAAPGGGGGGLPVTGAPVAAVAATGAGLVLGGCALLLARRRRDREPGQGSTG